MEQIGTTLCWRAFTAAGLGKRCQTSDASILTQCYASCSCVLPSAAYNKLKVKLVVSHNSNTAMTHTQLYGI